MSTEVIGGDGRIKDRTGVAPQGVVFRAKRTAVQTCANNVWVDFKPDSKQFDPFNFYDPATGRFQPKIPGYYRLSGCCYQQPGNSTTYTYWRIAKNGGPPNGPASRSMQQNGGTFILLSGSDIVYLNGTTDYATVQVQSDNYATGLGVYGDAGAEDYSWFEGSLIGVSVGVIPEPWHIIGAAGEVPFQNGWGSPGAAPARFYRDPNGMVHLAGQLSPSTANNGPAFTLPSGYRPGWLVTDSIGYWANPNDTIGRMEVGTDGTVRCFTATNGLFGASQSVRLDNHHFRADA